MVEIKKDDYIVAVWFLENSGKRNLLITLIKDCKTGGWTSTARARIYSDDKAFDSEDKKEVFVLAMPKERSEAHVIKTCQDLADRYKSIFMPDYTDFTEIGGGTEKLMEKLNKKEWFNMKVIDLKTEEGKLKARETLGEVAYLKALKDSEENCTH